MKKKVIVILSIILVILLTLSGIYIAYDKGYLFKSKEKEEQTYMPLTYEICDSNSCIYLLGSIHVGDKRVTKFDKKLIDLYNSSKYLAVELDTKNINMDYTKFIANPDETLNDLIPEEIQNELKDFLKEKSILSYDQLQYFKVGYVSNYLSLLPTMELGLASSGVDEYFIGKAHQEKKEIIELETYEEQISFLLDYSNEFYLNQIKDTINNYDELKTSMSSLYEEYLKSNKETLEILLNEETNYTTEEEKEYENKMMYERNKKMSLKVEEFLKKDQEVFMIVGLAHVIGSEGILDILQDQNYKIKLIVQNT